MKRWLRPPERNPVRPRSGLLRRRSFFDRIFINLTLFLAIPVIVMFVVSDVSVMGVIQDEIGKTSVERLRVASNLMRIIDDQVENTCARIALDRKLTQLAETKHFDDIRSSSETLYDFYEYGVFLDNLVRTNVTFYSIHIWIEGTDYVISSVDGTTPLTEFSDAAWLQSIIQEPSGTTPYYAAPQVPGLVAWSNTPTAGGDATNQVIPFIYPLSSYLTGLQGIVVLNLRASEYSRLINSSNFDTSGSIATISPGGTIMSDTDASLVGSTVTGLDSYRRILAAGDSVGYFTAPGEGVNHLITWLRDDRNAWLLVGDFSLAGLRQRVSNVRLLTLAITVAILFVGILGSRIVSARISSPFRRLLRQIEARRGGEQIAGANELTLLASAIDSLVRREKQLFSTQARETVVRRESWVRGVLLGVQMAGEPRPRALTGGRCAAAIVRIDGYREFAERTSAEEREHFRSILGHMAEEAFLPLVHCASAPLESDAVMLVLATDESDDSLHELLEARFARLRSESVAALQTTVSMGVGTFSEDEPDLAGSWDEAHEQIARRFIAGAGRWFWASEPRRQIDAPLVFPRREERQIVRALGANDTDAIDEGVSDFFRQVGQNGELSVDQATVILNQLIGSILKQLLEADSQLSEYFGHDYNLYTAMAELETIDEVQRWFREILRTIVARHAEQVHEQAGGRAMAEYIRANYRRDIGVEQVARHVGLSYSHARKVFRDEFGDSIVGFTNAIRIDDARRLLRETEEKLERIAQFVGYNNAQSLNRYFKKYTGLTPGEYRAQFRVQA